MDVFDLYLRPLEICAEYHLKIIYDPVLVVTHTEEILLSVKTLALNVMLILDHCSFSDSGF
jgi:hypothetical protein